MENQTPNTDNNVENTTANTTAPVTPTFQSSIKGLAIALAGEQAKQPVRTAMQFQSAELTMEKGTGKTWIMIHVNGLSLPIFRNAKQSAADLSNYIDAGTFEHLSASGIEKAYNKHFRNKLIFGSVAVYDKGSLYIVDENSTAFKNNTAQIGEELVAESAGVRIDGFLRASLSDEENDALYEQELAFAREQQAKVTSGAKFSIS